MAEQEANDPLVSEEQLLVEFGRMIRTSCLHAQRCGTHGQATLAIALKLNGAAVVGWNFDRSDTWSEDQCFERLDLLSPGLSGSQSDELFWSADTTINIDECAGSNRVADHAGWGLLNDLFRALLGQPICQVMDYDGTYRINAMRYGNKVVDILQLEGGIVSLRDINALEHSTVRIVDESSWERLTPSMNSGHRDQLLAETQGMIRRHYATPTT